MLCMCDNCTTMFRAPYNQVATVGSWSYQQAAAAGSWLYSWGPWTREQLSSRYPLLYDNSCTLAKWLTLNVANAVYVGTSIISLAGAVFLVLRIFDPKDFATKLGMLTVGFWEAPDTIILTLVSILGFCGRPLWQIFGSSGGTTEKQYILGEISRIITGSGIAAYLADIYQLPPMVKYVLIVLISAPFILLLFCALGGTATSKKIKAYAKKLKEWIQVGAWSGAWVNGANVAQALGAGIAAAITFCYDASHQNNLSAEKLLVLVGTVSGFIVGMIAVYLEKSRGNHMVATVVEAMEKFSLSFFYLMNYFLVFYEASNPEVLSAPGFNEQKDTAYPIGGMLLAAAMTATGVEMWLPGLTKTQPQYPSWSDIRQNPLQIIHGFTSYFRQCLGAPVTIAQAAQPVLPQFGRVPTPRVGSSLEEPLLPLSGGTTEEGILPPVDDSRV